MLAEHALYHSSTKYESSASSQALMCSVLTTPASCLHRAGWQLFCDVLNCSSLVLHLDSQVVPNMVATLCLSLCTQSAKFWIIGVIGSSLIIWMITTENLYKSMAKVEMIQENIWRDLNKLPMCTITMKKEEILVLNQAVRPLCPIAQTIVAYQLEM